MSVGRATVGYLYCLEFVPLSSQATVGTIMQIFSSSVTLILTLYFYFISRYWLWIQVFGWTFNLITVVGVIFMPESPKYLLTTRRYDECRQVLTKIGKFNKGAMEFNGVFDIEIEDKKQT
jgi:hypothetical protein